MLRGLGGFLVGASVLPLLPVARNASAGPTTPLEEVTRQAAIIGAIALLMAFYAAVVAALPIAARRERKCLLLPG